jgi:hypothetical protein
MNLYSTIVPYILLVSFYSGQINNFGVDKINAINASPYNGVAVALTDAYDTNKYTGKDFESIIKTLNKSSKKHIWPWVFFNRFIGNKESDSANTRHSDAEYFRRMKGMDIYNESGALNDFYSIWKISLTIANRTNSPGIVIDPESYNNRQANSLTYLSKRLGKSNKEIKERLKMVGKELLDIGDDIYPDATFWFFSTGLVSSFNKRNPFAENEGAISYIIYGMLERNKEKGSKHKFIEGGEVMPWGYCYKNLADLNDKKEIRYKKYEYLLNSYPNLYLGGTIAPWDKPSSKRSWLLQREECIKSEQKTIDDFKPLIHQLLKSYNYVWIYAAMAAGYDPYNIEIASKYNEIIEEVKTPF